MKTILITGGAGYLGLNISLPLLESGNTVVIVDDMKNSYSSHINNLLKTYPAQTKFYKGNVCDQKFMKSIFETHKPNIVLHLAALKYVGESIQNPQQYFENNMKSLEVVLSLSKEYNVSRFAFSSSAVVYGNTNNLSATEDFDFNPLSPYAETKCNGEKLITESKLNITIFRFSNPVGANTKLMFGDHSKKHVENLVPYIVKCAIENKPMVFKGNNHPTPDGTAVRDYIFVGDLAKIVSHILLSSSQQNEVLNISSGTGYSVLEILKTTEQLLNKPLCYSFKERNENESSISILDNSKLKNNYNIAPQTPLKEIIKTQILFQNHFKNN